MFKGENKIKDMSNVKSVNFFDLCRVCTASTEHKIDIFSSEGKTKNLCAKIVECLPLNVEETDRLPKVLCQQCVQNLESFLEFRNLCRNSQVMLTSCLNTATIHNGGKVLIKDVTTSENNLNIGNNNSQPISQQQAAMSQQQASTPASQSLTHQQPVITLQGSQLVAQATQAAPVGSFQGHDFLNSIMHAVGIQTDTLKHDKSSMPQYTITLDNNIQTPLIQTTLSAVASGKKDESNKNALEEFLKMKPNIKVTHLNKKNITQQQQDQQYHQTQHDQLLQQQQQQQMVQLQLQQLQQQLQQQWQQQQLQQQIQFLTSQLQPQQITITGGSFQSQPDSTSQQQTTQINDATQTLDSNSNVNSIDSDELSPSKCKKSKLNVVLTPPTVADMPQIPSQIQLQIQPTLGQQSFFQPSQPTTAATLLSNLAPLLQPQTQLNNAVQTQVFTANQATNVVSPNKCFLPITIKDDSTDQQFVAHIDAKNFLLPTTYQLQMKLQPQIATVDGHPIMQLAPTSIPARLQLTPQTLGSATCITPLGGNNTQPSNTILSSSLTPLSQISQLSSESTQTQTLQSKQPVLQQQQKQSDIQQNGLQTSIGSKMKNVQITAQEIINTALDVKSTPSSSSTSTNSDNQKAETEKKTQENLSAITTTNTSSESVKVVPRQKFKISHQTGSNTIEITPTTTLTQQIMLQVQQQQMQKQRQRQSVQKSSTVATQHGGITVQRVTAKPSTDSATTHSTKLTNDNLIQTNIPSLPLLNKNNITISRITPQNQKSAKYIPSDSTSKGPGDVTPALPVTTSLKVLTQQQNLSQRQFPHPASTKLLALSSTPLQKSQALSNIPNTTLRISPTKKVLKKVSASKAIGDSIDISTQNTQNNNSLSDEEKIGKTTSNATESSVENLSKIKQESPTKNNSSSVDISSSSSSVIECNQCSKIFKKKEHLTQHLKLHTGIRPFTCKERGCPKSFSRKEHLLRHLVSHSGKKMFSCDICQKPFSRKDNLNKHRRIHLDGSGNNYVCEICNKTFVVKAYYTQHKLLHKKDSEAPDNQLKGTEANKAQINQDKYENHNSNETPTPQLQTVRAGDPMVMLQQVPRQPQNLLQQSEHSDHQQQQLQLQQQQLQLVQQQIQQLQQQQQSQVQPQIMHLQLPSSMVSSQDMAGSTITITPAATDSGANSLKAHHGATVLNLPTSLGNFVQLSQTQFVNAATGQIMGHLKLEK